MFISNNNIPNNKIFINERVQDDSRTTSVALKALYTVGAIFLSLTVVGAMVAAHFYVRKAPGFHTQEQLNSRLILAQQDALEEIEVGEFSDRIILKVWEMIQANEAPENIRQLVIKEYPNASPETKKYFKTIAETLRSDVDMRAYMREHFEELLRSLKGENECSLQEFGHIMQTSVAFSYLPSFDSLLDKIMWFWENFNYVVFQQFELYSDPANTDLTKYRNINHFGHDYAIGPATVRFHHGPSASGDPLFQPHIDNVKERGGIYLYHNLLSTKKRVEKERALALKEIEEKNDGTLRLFTTNMDGSLWKMQKEHMEWETGEEFIEHYRKVVTQDDAHLTMKENDNGFYIPESVLSNGHLHGAIDAVKTAAGALEVPTKEEKKRLGRSLQIATQGMIAFGAMIQASKDANLSDQPSVSFMQACKGDLDRGGVANILQRIYHKLWKDEQFTKAEVEEILGTFLGRLRYTTGRNILSDRYEPFVDLIEVIVKNQERFQSAIHKYAESFACHGDELTEKEQAFNDVLFLPGFTKPTVEAG